MLIWRLRWVAMRDEEVYLHVIAFHESTYSRPVAFDKR